MSDYWDGFFQRAHFDDAEERLVIQTIQDEKPIVDANKRMFNAGDGSSPSRELQHVARIPNALVEKWLREEGINIFNKNHWPAVIRKLNSSEYLWLRTSAGRL